MDERSTQMLVKFTINFNEHFLNLFTDYREWDSMEYIYLQPNTQRFLTLHSRETLAGLDP